MGILTDSEKRWARDKYKQGYSVRDIASKLFVSHGTINNAVKGIKRKELPPLETPQETAERLHLAIDTLRAR